MNSFQRLINRYKLLELIKSTIDLQAKIYVACKNDIFFWINNFCWTYDPRVNPSQIAIELYPFQKDSIKWIIDHIENKKDGLIEKSRDMGATWMFVYVFQWYWQFKEAGNDFHIGSRKEDFVDKLGDMSTIFEKFRYNISKQPISLLPFNFNPKDIPYMKIVNNKTGSSITGEACNQYFGTGGRYKAALLDEYAKWENRDQSAWQSLGDATPCRFPISSANGKNNYFYKLRSQEEIKIDVLPLHWKQHPLKDDKWYEEEKRRRSPAELAAEVDIDYSASVSKKAAENWNPSIHIIKNGEMKYDPLKLLDLTCDFNIDPMCWSVAQDAGHSRDFTFKEYTEQTTITEKVIIKFVNDFKDHKYRYVYLYGDASGKSGSTRSKESDYDIIERILKANEWKVIKQIPLANPPIIDRLNATNKRLQDWQYNNQAFEFVSKDCPKLIDSIEQTKRKDDGIDKDGSEHHFDGWSYRIAKKYPVKESKAGVQFI